MAKSHYLTCSISFTILTAIEAGVLDTGHIEGPYALDDVEEVDTLQADLCCPSAHQPVTKTVVESDCSEQRVNKQLLAKSAAYFGLKTVRNAWKHIICVHKWDIAGSVLGPQYGPNPSIQPLKLRFSGCIEGNGPY